MTTIDEATAQKRAQYTAGLRALADLLDGHPDLQLPFHGTGTAIAVHPFGEGVQRKQLAAWARALPGHKEKKPTGGSNELFKLEGALDGLKVEVVCDRTEVCERVVVGTREVTEDQPDPELLKDIPIVQVTRTEEVVEWRCNSILADAAVA